MNLNLKSGFIWHSPAFLSTVKSHLFQLANKGDTKSHIDDNSEDHFVYIIAITFRLNPVKVN